MKIEHVMSTNLIVADVNTDIKEIASIMKKNDIGFLPISENKKIIGVITDRDIVTKIIANGDEALKGYLSRDLITIDSDKTIDEALKLMSNKKVKRLLVEKESKLIGVVSLSDLIQYDNDLFLESLKKIWEINRNTDFYPTAIDEFEL